MNGIIAASRQRIKYDPDFKILIDRAKVLGLTLPNKSWLKKGNDLMISLKSDGIYSECDLIYIMMTDGGSLEFSSLNWKNNTSYDLINIDNPVFVDKKGIKYNGNSYSRNNWRTNLGVKYQPNNAAVSFKLFDMDDDVFTASEGILGARTADNNSQLFVFRNTLTTISGRLSTISVGAPNNFNISEFDKHVHIAKTSSTTYIDYLDGVSTASNTALSGTVGTIETAIGALNNNGTIANKLKGGISYLFIGSNMSSIQGLIYSNMLIYKQKIESDSPSESDPDKIIIAELGQSNMEGRSGDTSNGAYPFPVTDAWYFNGTSQSQLTTLRGGAIGGSHANYFAEKIKTLSAKKPVMLECARGGTGLTVQAGGQDNWSSAGGMRGIAQGAIESALSFYGKTAPACALWCQGERDATAMNNDVTYTKEIVKSAMQSVIDWWFGLYPGVPFLISETGDINTGTNTIGYQNIRSVQNEIVAENINVYMAFTGAKNFPSQGKMIDTDHYNYVGLKEMGEAFATTLSTLV